MMPPFPIPRVAVWPKANFADARGEMVCRQTWWRPDGMTANRSTVGVALAPFPCAKESSMKKRVPAALFALSLALLAPAIAPAAKPEPERRAKERRPEREKPERAERPDRRREAPRDDREPSRTRDLPQTAPATCAIRRANGARAGERTQGEQVDEILRDSAASPEASAIATRRRAYGHGTRTPGKTTSWRSYKPARSRQRARHLAGWRRSVASAIARHQTPGTRRQIQKPPGPGLL
jgi:hypothetical protein